MNENKSHQLSGIYAITDERLIAEQDFNDKVEQALIGGASIIQYRDKSKDTNKRFQQAQSLRQLCQKYHALCIINDDIELAKSVNAHGVHLGKHDASPVAAREILGDEAIIGVSCYNNINLATNAEKNDADYVAFGAMFSSPTKPDAVIADQNILSQAKEKISLPICVIGGINENNVFQLVQQGADMTAVISCIFSSDNIVKATRSLQEKFTT